MAKDKDIITIPCVVYKPRKGGCYAKIPDLNMTIHGTSFVEVIANSVLAASAIYIYKADRNISMNITTTYEELAKNTTKDKTPHFVHMLTVSREG